MKERKEEFLIKKKLAEEGLNKPEISVNTDKILENKKLRTGENYMSPVERSCNYGSSQIN